MKYVKCDLCKAGPVEIERGKHSPTNWRNTEIRLPNYVMIPFDICPQCSIRTGLPTIETTTPSDDLYNIVVGIIEEAIEDNQP
jgi:hypothetical protein